MTLNEKGLVENINLTYMIENYMVDYKVKLVKASRLASFSDLNKFR